MDAMTPLSASRVMSREFLLAIISQANDYDGMPPKHGPYFLTREHWQLKDMADELLALRAEVLRLRGAEWQPIETAPKTTRSILVWCPERKNCHMVWWDSYVQDGAWVTSSGHRMLSDLNEPPTHWRPLPPPPGGAHE